MDFFNVKSLANAKEMISECFPVLKGESLPLCEALGRTAYENIYSHDILPPYNRSTVDGYAVKTSDTGCASESIPAVLKITGKINIGEKSDIVLQKGQAAAVATGSLVPEGADGVVMIEHTSAYGDELFVFSPLKHNENLVIKGEDIAKGDMIVEKGKILTPFDLSVLASVGISKVNVFANPNICIISSGDELTDIDGSTKNGKIRDVNTTLLYCLARENGFNTVSTLRVGDNASDINDAFDSCLSKSDIVIISGGSSVGSRDLTAQIIEKKAEILFHGVALKPGKPTVAAKTDNNKLILGLPGHPFAAAVAFKLLLCDIFREKCSLSDAPIKATAKINFHGTPGRTTVVPVKLSNEGGNIFAYPIFMKSAHISALLNADGYALIHDNEEGKEKGDSLLVYKL